jgi:hypoxanthine phosphoribosyltransferase
VRVLRTALQIQDRVREMATQIASDYAGERPLLVGVLKGACMFQCDLARALPIEAELDFLQVSSYGDRLQGGTVELRADLSTEIGGRHVVVCEGVVDSGRSLSFVLQLLKARRPASLRVATLLDKRPCREVEVPLDYVGWVVGADFLVGYGLDAAERYRNLPFVGVLEE